MKVGIIGGGIAGLCTAKTLKSCGYEVVLFEKEADVGGVWSASRRYPGLTTQNPRDTYAYSDFPMPKSYPEWPSGAQVQAYLEQYVDAFGLRDVIKVSTEVTSARPRADAKGWTLTVHTAGATAAQTIEVDWLIVCNGIFSVPVVPNFAGADAFKAAGGLILHTSQFTDIKQASGKHVLVVGYGKSSCDVANALAGVSASTTVIARHLIWKIPKKLMNVLNFKHLFLTRLGEGLFKYIHVKGFEAFLHGPGVGVRNSMLASVEGVIAKQLKLKDVGLHPGKPLETIARSTVSLVTDGFYEKIRSGALSIKAGAQIDRLSAGFAVLSSGEIVKADVIVCGTGWDQQIPFFESDIVSKVTDARGVFRLYRSMIPTGVERLAFNGYNSSFFSQLNAEVSALWLAELMSGAPVLPSVAEREAYIDARLAWMEARTDGKHSKGTNIIPFSVHHMDELLEEMDLRLPVLTRLKHWLMAINAADYAPLHRRWLRRHVARAKAA
jgi:cation diffusion facilitator CzcD-associated flavoprotein CzcO